jgi:hypothetical protein
MVTLGGDNGFMVKAARQDLKAAREGGGTEKLDPETSFY